MPMLMNLVHDTDLIPLYGIDSQCHHVGERASAPGRCIFYRVTGLPITPQSIATSTGATARARQRQHRSYGMRFIHKKGGVAASTPTLRSYAPGHPALSFTCQPPRSRTPAQPAAPKTGNGSRSTGVCGARTASVPGRLSVRYSGVTVALSSSGPINQCVNHCLSRPRRSTRSQGSPVRERSWLERG